MSFTPDLVDPDAPFSERMLVCEGECNPEIHEYDVATRQYHRHLIGLQIREVRMLVNTVADWVRRLKHTPHMPESATPIFRDGTWCRAWRCTVCGTRRFF